MSNEQQQPQPESVGPSLTKDEQEEVKALQDERKIAGEGKGPAFSDSHRVRLSELLKKEEESKPSASASSAASKSTSKTAETKK